MNTQDVIAKWQAADKAQGADVLSQLSARWPRMKFEYEGGGWVRCSLPAGATLSVDTGRDGWMARVEGKVNRYRLWCQEGLALTAESITGGGEA